MNNSDFIFYKIGGSLHMLAAALIIMFYHFEHYGLCAAIGIAVCLTWWILLSIAYKQVKKRDEIIEEELRK